MNRQWRFYWGRWGWKWTLGVGLTVVSVAWLVAGGGGSAAAERGVLDAVGSRWGQPVSAAGGGNQPYTSLAVVNGNPAIGSYYGSGDLIYVRATNISGSSWGSPVSVDTVGNVGEYVSLKVVNGNPAMSYYDVTNGR